MFESYKCTLRSEMCSYRATIFVLQQTPSCISAENRLVWLHSLSLDDLPIIWDVDTKLHRPTAANVNRDGYQLGMLAGGYVTP